MKRAATFVLVGLIVGFLLGYLVASRPRTYADCLLAHVKQGMNVEATELAAGACRAKYAATADAVPEPPERPGRGVRGVRRVRAVRRVR